MGIGATGDPLDSGPAPTHPGLSQRSAHAPADRPTLADRIHAALSQRILSGTLPAGEKLRQEEIAAEFAASQGPVREAFRVLEAEGLVLSQPRRGVRVAPLDRAALIEATEMRAVLEGLAVRQASAHFSAADLQRLHDADAACSAALTPEAWDDANRAFHAALIATCPMPRLMQSITRLQALASRFAQGRARSPALPHNDRDHKAILTALQARDGEQAGALLARHIRRGAGLA